MVKILVMSLGLDTESVPEKPTFDDVPKNHWAYRYVEAAYKEGIINGVASGLFAPDEKCTREQLAKMFINSMKLVQTAFSLESDEQSGIERFNDYGKISGWARDAVNLAVYCGIMKGTGSKTFSPAEYATKEQMAVVTDRFITEKVKIQEKLDAISNIQVTGGQSSLYFAFPRPIEALGIRSISGQKTPSEHEVSNKNLDVSESYRKWLAVDGEYVAAEVSFYPAVNSDNGETCKVRFSFRFKEGNGEIINCERTVSISGSDPFVKYVMPLNANQIRVRFSDGADVESAKNPDNYALLDENGKPIPIGGITVANSKNDTKYAIINLLEPLTKRTKITVHVKEGIKLFSDGRIFLPYSSTITVDDRTTPDIEQVKFTDDGKYITSVSLMFNEPVASGTVMIDNVPAGTAKGEITTISGLKLDGASSHNIKVSNISDGVNTNKSSTVKSMAQIYDPSGTDTVPPAIKNVAFTKDADGRVDSIILAYGEDLQPWVPSGHITAFDSNHKPVYAEVQGTDENGDPVLFDENGKPVQPMKIFCVSTDIPGKDRKAIFRIAEGLDIYSGRYTIVLPKDLVVDLEYNGSEEEAIIINF